MKITKSLKDRSNLISLVITIFFAIGLFLSSQYTGFTVIQAPNTLTGNIILTLESGEFLPSSTTISLLFNNQAPNKTLKEIIEESDLDLTLKNDTFNSTNTELRGYGEGYGFIAKVLYPNVTFTYNITLVSQTNLTMNESDSQIVSNEYSVLEQGAVNYNNTYTFNISSELNQTIEELNITSYVIALIPNSVKALNKTISDSNITLNPTDSEVTATTTYSETENISKSIRLSISSFNLTLPTQSGNYTLTTKVLYNDTLITQSTEIIIIENITEITSNITNLTAITSQEKTTQQRAMINKPVIWIKEIKLSNITSNVSVNLPTEASNITVEKVTDTSSEVINPERIRVNDSSLLKPVEETNIQPVTGFSLYTFIDTSKETKEGIKEKTEESPEQNITFNDSLEEDIEILPNITEPQEINETNLTLIVEEEVEELKVTYETSAPLAIESIPIIVNDKWIKNITIFSNTTLHYQNVLAYTELPELSIEQIHLFWINNTEIINETVNSTNESSNLITGLSLYTFVDTSKTNESLIEKDNKSKNKTKENITEINITEPITEQIGNRIEVTSNEEYNVTFIDANDNGLIDLVYWNVPGLSEQEFIIEADLTVINVQSYPTVGGNWTVMFNTTGTANLTITATNGTVWSNINENNDLKFLEIKCGNNTLNYTWIDNGSDNSSVFISNYSCNQTGFEISKVLTEGIHTLQFRFGSDIEYAYNQAENITYENMSDVYHNFEWVGNNVKMQVRSCSQADCSDASFEGPDNTSSTWFTNPNLNDVTGNVSKQRYFQYKAYLFRNITLGQNYTSELHNVTIGAHNSTYIEKPVIKPNYFPHHRSILNCTTKAYSPNTTLNVTFNWYNGSVFYSQENITTTSGTYVGYGLSEKPTFPEEQWNCTVYAYDSVSYSENKSDSVNISSVVYDYYNLQNVFHNFEWIGNNMKVQVRSCSQADCSDGGFIGQDNSSSSWFDNPNYENLSLTNLSNARYFQYKVYLYKNTTFAQAFTPEFYNLTVLTEGGYIATSLVIWDDSDSATSYANFTKFYANYTKASSGDTINGTSIYCEFRHNKTGSWQSLGNMSFNGTTEQYEFTGDCGYLTGHACIPVGNYSFNASCYDSNLIYSNNSNASDVTISDYSTSLAVENDTGKVTDEQVYFYANYTKDGGYGVQGLSNEIGRIIWNTSDLGDESYSIAFFDCENKGKKDCVAVGARGDLETFYPNGSSLWVASDPSWIISEIEVGDLDNDSYENDILIPDAQGYVSVFNETGDEVWTNGVDVGWLVSVAIGDLDNDGLKNDIIAGGTTAGTERLLMFNNSDGITWGNIWNFTTIDTVDQIIIADMDSDGYEDDVVATDRSGYLHVLYRNNGTAIWNTTDIGGVFSIAVLDLDHDGYKDDVVVGAQNALYAYVWNGTIGASYADGEETWKKTGFSNSVLEIYATDLDNDGYEDDVVAGDYNNLWWIDNNSNTIFQHDFAINNNYVNSISVADINNDGDIEIIAGRVDDTLYAFNKSGSLLWSYTIGLGDIGDDVGSSPATDISDINNDGISDIAVSSADGYAHIFNQMPDCIIEFNDTSTVYNMTWNTTDNIWMFNRTFTNVGGFEWNITCEKNGYVTQIAGDNVTIAAVPTTPSINYPINFTNISDSTPQIEISNSTDADGNDIYYIIEISNDTDFTTISFFSGNIQETSNTTKWNSSEIADGSYYIRALATDLIYNSSYSDYKNFTIDTTAPSITITSPTQNTPYKGVMLITTDITDTNGISYAYYNITNQSNDLEAEGNLNSTENWNATFNTSTVGDGNYTLNVFANDTLGNPRNDTINFKIDNTNPIITWTTPKNDNSSAFNSAFNLNVQFQDNNLFETLINITNSTGDSVYLNSTYNVNISIQTYTDQITLTTDGNYTIEASTSDDHTDSETDLQKGKKGESILIFNSSSSNLNIIAYFIEKNDKLTDTPGDFVSSISELSAQGYYKFGFNFTVLKPQTKLILNLSSNQKLYYRTSKTEIKGHFVWDKYYMDFADLPKDMNLTVTQTDDYNYQIRIEGSEHWAGNDFIEIDPVAGGLNIVTEYVTFVYDTVEPAITLVQPTDYLNTSTNNWSFNYTAFDNNSDTCEFYHNISGTFAFNQSNPNSTNFTINNLPDTTFIWNVKCNDTANNNNWSSKNYTLTIDTVEPAITLDTPVDYYNTSTSTLDFNYSVIDENLATCELWTNATGTFALNQSTTSLANFTIENLPGTAFIWNIRCNDSANNINWSTRNYTVTITTTSLAIFDQEKDTETQAQSNDTSVYVNEQTYFYANYTRTDTNAPLLNANCTIVFSDLNANMTYDPGWSLYYYNRTFSKATNYNWSINCTKTSFNPQNASSNITIKEFSIEHVYITPDPAYTLDNLTCMNGSLTNEGIDNITLHYKWYKNSQLVTMLNFSTVSSATSENPGNEATKAIDNNLTSYWISALGTPASASITFNLTENKTIGRLTYRFNASSYTPDNFEIQYSTDGTTFIALYLNQSQQTMDVDVQKIFTPVNASSIRFYFTNPNSDAGLGGLTEFNVYATNVLYYNYFSSPDNITCTIAPQADESIINGTIVNSTTRYRKDTTYTDFGTGTLEQVNITWQSGNITLANSSADAYYLSGNFTSPAIDLKKASPNLTTISWTNTSAAGTNITFQTRTSSDNANWSSWSGSELENTTNTTLLLHLNSNHSTYNGQGPATSSGISYTAAKYQQGILINNSDSLTYSTTNTFDRNKGTIEFWVKPLWQGNDSKDYYFFDQAAAATVNRFRIYKESNNNLTFMLSDSTDNDHKVTTNVSYWQANELYHVAVTYTTGEIKLYINGTLLDTNTDAWSTSSTAASLFIGSDYNSQNQANSTIDEFVIYNKVLTASEIQEHYETYYTNNSAEYIAYPHARYIQYKALLQTNDTNKTPILESVTIKQENYVIVIKDTTPLNVSLITPANNSWQTTSTPTFNWTDSVDDDNDTVYYELLIDDNSDFSSLEVNKSVGPAEDNITDSNYTLTTSEALSDGTYYWKVRATDLDDASEEDETAYSNYTETYTLNIDTVTPLIWNGSRTPVGTIYEVNDVDFFVNVSDENIDTVLFESNFSTTLTNYTLTNYTGNSTDRRYNFTIYSADLSSDELVVWRFYVNDSANTLNQTAQYNFTVTAAIDFNITNVTYPITVYSNLTYFNINVSNEGQGSANNINVSCYINNTIIDSYLINLSGITSNTSRCQWTATYGKNHLFNATVDPDNAFSETNESNNYYSFEFNVTQTTTLDAFDQEDDAEDKAGWLTEQIALPDTQTYVLANYTHNNDSKIVPSANCTIEFSDSTINMSYNSTALLYYYNRTFENAGAFNWSITCSKTEYENKLSTTTNLSVRIPLENATVLGLSTKNESINSNEIVNISVVIPAEDIDETSNNLSSVWVEITKPDTYTENLTLSGNIAGGIWNLTFTNITNLGTYRVRYYANLSDSFALSQFAEANFSIENITLSLSLDKTDVNTTETITATGRALRFNGSENFNISNNALSFYLSGSILSNNYSENSNQFTSGTLNNTKLQSTSIILNLTQGAMQNYSDDYSTTKYLTDAYNYSSIGYSTSPGGMIFDLDDMSQNIGNITYSYSATFNFSNATVYITTAPAEYTGGGNVSLWYSYTFGNWTPINSTTASSATMITNIPVSDQDEFYIKIEGDKSSGDNPVTKYEINYTEQVYSDYGEFTSQVINLSYPIVYSGISWTTTEPSNTSIKMQTRTSADNSTWTAWSSNYTNSTSSSILSTAQRYIQYRALLETNNTILTPELNTITITYSNESTNSTGYYTSTFTIPTTQLGNLTFKVNLTTSSGLIEENFTYIEVWAAASIAYKNTSNHSGAISFFNITANYSRDDLNSLIFGAININVSNSTDSVTQSCDSAKVCSRLIYVPSNLSRGNYNVTITTTNASAYYRNASTTFVQYIEGKSTTGTLYSANRTISDFSSGSAYSFLWNATLTNTAQATMNSIIIWNYDPASDIDDVVNITSCNPISPDSFCNLTFNITVAGTFAPGTYRISWKSSWKNNDETTGTADFTDMFVTIEGTPTMNVSKDNITADVEHSNTFQDSFLVQSTGAGTILAVNITWYNDSMPSEWLTLSDDYFANIPAGSSQNITATVTVPEHYAPGIYDGRINVTTTNAENASIVVNITVPTNATWHYLPRLNHSFNTNFTLNQAGEIGNLTINNTGNIDLNFTIAYSPWSTTDYTGFGTALFQENYAIGSLITNPTSKLVGKNSTAVITLYQKGNSNAQPGVGVLVNISNTTANPTSNITYTDFNIQEAAPEIVNVLFFTDANSTTIVEQNLSFKIKAVVTDDVAINITNTWYIINWTDGSDMFLANSTSESEYSGANALKMNFTGNFTTGSAGTYNVSVKVSDETGNTATSTVYQFTSTGTTTGDVTANQTSFTVTEITQTQDKTFYLDFTVNNTGLVNSYDNTLTFTKPSGWTITPSFKNFGTLKANSSASQVFTINIPSATSPSSYDITATLNWNNPDSTSSSDSTTTTVTVNSNKLIELSKSSISLTINHSKTNSDTFFVNATGNDDLTDIQLTCQSGTVCTAFTVSFNDTNFNLSAGDIRTVNVSVTVPTAYTPGTYTGVVNASAENASTLQLSITVPTDDSWNIVPLNFSLSRGANEAGTVGTVNVSNAGNIDIFLNVNATNSSIIVANVSNITVSKNTVRYVMVNYSAPVLAGEYNENITFTNSSTTLTEKTVEVNLTVSNLTVNLLSPTQLSPLTNVTNNEVITITAQATYEGANITLNMTYEATIGSSACSDISQSYSASTKRWEITCKAPNLTDGASHNLELTGTYTTIGTSYTDSETNAVSYRDITAPTLQNKTKQDVLSGNNVTLTISATDNVNVSAVIVQVTYPNSTSVNYTMNLSNSLYNHTLYNLVQMGDYEIAYYANDTTDNLATDTDWFEVYVQRTFSGTITDHNNNGVTTRWYFYKANSTRLLANFTTDSTGVYSVTLHNRTYDVRINAFQDILFLHSVDFNKTGNDIIRLDNIEGSDLTDNITNYKLLTGFGMNITVNFSSEASNATAAEITISYAGKNPDVESNIRMFYCSSWDFISRSCNSTFTQLSTYDLDTELDNITANVTALNETMAYMVAEYVCGNGICEIAYGETTSTCPDDCVAAAAPVTYITGGAGGGGGGGGVREPRLKEILEEVLKAVKVVSGVEILTKSISVQLYPGESATERLTLKNTQNREVVILVQIIEGEIRRFVFFENPFIELAPGEKSDVVIRIHIPETTTPGSYIGNIVLTGKEKEDEVTIPINIRVLLPEEKLLDLKINPLKSIVTPGSTLKIQNDIYNLGKTKRVDVELLLQLLDPETDKIITQKGWAIAVETTVTVIEALDIPEDIKLGDYLIKGTAYYATDNRTMYATSLASIRVQETFLNRSFLGVKIKIYLLILMVSIINLLLFYYYMYRRSKKKRYKVPLDLKSLAQPGPRAAFIGKVAETGMRTFFDLDLLQTHTLIAGSTGSGKTIAAQDIVEEALLKGTNVVVFDPTAQWTGFLRKCNQKYILKRYGFFDMKIKDTKAFDGSIHIIKDPREIIDVKRCMQPGQITIFDIHSLEPKEIDILITSTIYQIFRANLPESHTLKTLIVYDEVHRLLPKFGGSGKGLIQLERGAREFRKWGVGLILISQVLSDFVGEIKANIATEIQMRTRYEGDLERIKLKYGEETLTAVVKESVGTGMAVNAQYNNGRPYFVSFRPILHSVSRLSDKELELYKEYDEKIEDLRYQIEQLKAEKADVFDLELELKLAESKVRKGAFNMVDIYLDSLIPRVDTAWKKIGKQPKKKATRLMIDKELIESVGIAKEEREKYVEKEEKGLEKKMKDYLKAALKQGKSAEEIKRLALKANWPVDLVNKLIKEAKEQK